MSIDLYSNSFNYLSVVHSDQLVVTTTMPSQCLHRWDLFTGEVANDWTISSDHGKYSHFTSNLDTHARTHALTHTTYDLIKPYFLISIGFTHYNIQGNSTTLALYGGEEDQGNLYIYKLDGT